MAESMIGTAISSYTFLVVSLLWKTRSEKNKNKYMLDQTNKLCFHSELVVSQRNKIVRIYMKKYWQCFLTYWCSENTLLFKVKCVGSHIEKIQVGYPICFQ